MPDASRPLRLLLDANVIVHVKRDPLEVDWAAACKFDGDIELVLCTAVLRELDAHSKNFNKPRQFQERARKRRERLVKTMRSGVPAENQRANVSLSYLECAAVGDEGILEALGSIAAVDRGVALATDDNLLALRAERACAGVVLAELPGDFEVFESRETQERLRDLT